jgi:hypothetical protein
MYTNISTENLMPAIQAACKKAQFSDDLTEFLVSATEFLNKSVFFLFQNKLVYQSYGVAMGLACAPTMANLFMGIWEDHINVQKLFCFYRRYIDDVFALTQGEDPTYRVKIPGLVLEWESKETLSFLDCEVFSKATGEISVRPYTKPLSHYQYIPWNSGHPLHVKRGLVKTELIRYSSLSSESKYFDERKQKLHTSLRSRGYPETALKAWMRQIKWTHPLDQKQRQKTSESRALSLFSPSEYNPVWDNVKFGPVWEAILSEMVRYSPQEPLPPFQNMTKSLQRTKNLWDFVRRTNRVLLELDKQDPSPTVGT